MTVATSALPPAVPDDMLDIQAGHRWPVWLAVVLSWPFVGWMVGLGGLFSYGVTRAVHALEARRRRGEDDAIPLSITVNLILIPVLTTIGSLMISVGLAGPSAYLGWVVGLAVVVAIAVLAWLIARGLADHESGRSVAPWDPTINTETALQQIRSNYAISLTHWSPAVAIDRARDGLRCADAVALDRLAGGDPNTRRPCAHSFWRQFRSVAASLWSAERPLLVVTWVWSLVLAVAGGVNLVGGSVTAGLGLLGIAMLSAVGLPLGELSAYAELESAYFLARLRERVLQARIDARQASEWPMADPMNRGDAIALALRTYSAARRGSVRQRVEMHARTVEEARR